MVVIISIGSPLFRTNQSMSAGSITIMKLATAGVKIILYILLNLELKF